jgi:DNA-binding response OmpR family regulator
MTEERNEAIAQTAVHSKQAKVRVLLTETLDARRAAVAMVLAQGGYEAAECSDVEAVMSRAKQVTPDVVLLDASLPNGEPEKCVRALKRCYQTASVSIVLACPQSFDRQRLFNLIQEGASTVLAKPYTREQLLQTVKTAAARAKSTRADLLAELGGQSAPTTRLESNNSLFARTICCPLHDDHPSLTRYLLRPGAVGVQVSQLDIPTYAPVAGSDPIDFNRLAVIVCPHCFFASSYAGYFLDSAERKEKRFTFDAATRRALVIDADARRESAKGLSPDFFNEKRTPGDAMAAHLLAIRCSGILYAHNPHTLPSELLRSANYRLTMAQLIEATDAAAARQHRQSAIEPLKQSVAAMEGEGRCKALYQLVALGIALEDHAMAEQYLTQLADLEARALGPVKPEIHPFLTRAHELWEAHGPKSPAAATAPAAAAA